MKYSRSGCEARRYLIRIAPEFVYVIAETATLYLRNMTYHNPLHARTYLYDFSAKEKKRSSKI